MPPRRKAPELVDVPSFRALVIDGAGAPATPAFTAAIGALYGAAYTITFARKKARRPPFKVGTLVGEWRLAGLPSARLPPSDRWRWRLELAVPRDVTAAELRAAIAARAAKKKATGADAQVALARVPARRCVRMMHVGPIAAEPKTIARMRAFAAARATPCVPWHVEVYCSDPRRTPPARLRTALLIVAA